MSLESLIIHYGYVALIVGTFIEGETIVVLAGLAAHQGYLGLGGVMFFAFLGTLAGDQTCFLLGRFQGDRFLQKRTAWQAKAKRTGAILARYHIPVVLGFRFMYGLRSIIPFLIGLTPMRIPTFAALNAVGAALWAVAVAAAGYFLGSALEAVLANIKHVEAGLTLAVCAIGLFFWLVCFIRRKAVLPLS